MRRLTPLIVLTLTTAAMAAPHLRGHKNEPVKSGPVPEQQPDVFPPPGSIPTDKGASHAGATSRPSAAETSEVRQAETALADVEKSLREKYQADPAYTAAVSAEKQARADYDAAAAKIGATLASDPAYAKAESDLKSAEADLETARNDSSLRDQLPVRAMAAMQARDALHQIEARAREGDPTVVAAAQKRAQAAADLGKVRAKFEAAMKDDPGYQAALKALADARSNAIHH